MTVGAAAEFSAALFALSDTPKALSRKGNGARTEPGGHGRPGCGMSAQRRRRQDRSRRRPYGTE